MSSFNLYMEMPDAHANPNAKLVMRVPSMVSRVYESWNGGLLRVSTTSGRVRGDETTEARRSM
jgi:hypothetical protein